jgi:hypothetical protein
MPEQVIPSMQEAPLTRIVVLSIIGGLALFVGMLILLFGYGGCCGGEGLLTPLPPGVMCSCAGVSPPASEVSGPVILLGAGLLLAAGMTGLRAHRENQRSMACSELALRR